MFKQSQPAECAHCSKGFPTVAGRFQSWRVGSKYTCNEYCADGVDETWSSRWRPSAETSQFARLSA